MSLLERRREAAVVAWECAQHVSGVFACVDCVCARTCKKASSKLTMCVYGVSIQVNWKGFQSSLFGDGGKLAKKSEARIGIIIATTGT